MADLRALMRERKATSKRIDHPFAKYGNSGQLSCSLCGLPVKNEVLWPAHLTSKVHRQNVRQQQLDAAQAAESTSTDGAVGSKRTADGDLSDDQNDGVEQQAGRAKRVRFEDENETDSVHNNVAAYHSNEATESSTSFLPPGFFDSPTTAGGATVEQNARDDAAGAVAQEQDDEMAEFEAFLAEPEPEASTSGSAATGPSVFSAAATISGEEMLFKTGEEEDEPAEGEQEGGEDEFEHDDGPPEETQEERLQREEREELMQRIETEEREQREADERVDALKKRLLSVRSNKKAGSGGDKVPSTGQAPVKAAETARERRRRRLGKQ